MVRVKYQGLTCMWGHEASRVGSSSSGSKSGFSLGGSARKILVLICRGKEESHYLSKKQLFLLLKYIMRNTCSVHESMFACLFVWSDWQVKDMTEMHPFVWEVFAGLCDITIPDKTSHKKGNCCTSELGETAVWQIWKEAHSEDGDESRCKLYPLKSATMKRAGNSLLKRELQHYVSVIFWPKHDTDKSLRPQVIV